MTDLKIHELNGVDSMLSEKLVSAGINNTSELLKTAATSMGRRDLSLKTGIHESTLLKFVNMADLTRIKGVGRQYSELFEAAGVDTVNELKNRNPENLMIKIKEANDKLKIAQSIPSTTQVSEFIEEAKRLEPVISY